MGSPAQSLPHSPPLLFSWDFRGFFLSFFKNKLKIHKQKTPANRVKKEEQASTLTTSWLKSPLLFIIIPFLIYFFIKCGLGCKWLAWKTKKATWKFRRIIFVRFKRQARIIKSLKALPLQRYPSEAPLNAQMNTGVDKVLVPFRSCLNLLGFSSGIDVWCIWKDFSRGFFQGFCGKWSRLGEVRIQT